MELAGSAIAQGPNVGRIDRLSSWKQNTAEPLWLLLAGATDPPNYINISGRRTRDISGDRSGTFLSGITHDLANVEDAVVESCFNLFNTVKDLYLTKFAARRHIRRLFDICKRKRVQPMLYYTGHGEIGTGNWCFDDGTISIQEIVNMLPGRTFYPMIFSDTCYSGHWANFCLQKDIAGFHCLAACPDYSTAIDTKGKGGDLTLFMTGKKPRPSTEPMYSGGNIDDFPITSGYDTVDYFDFISSHVINSENILICQSIHDGYFSGCFTVSKRYSPRAVSWGIEKNCDCFLELVNEECQRFDGRSNMIYSLACDKKLGFGVFFMENYGTVQAIVTSLSDIDNAWDDGFQITACAARGSTFYVIMTKDTEEYKGKAQSWFTGRTWTETRNAIEYKCKEGKVITGLCYSSGLRKYFVVMTEIPGGQQTSKWFDNRSIRLDWIDENLREGLHPTIIFRDPTLCKTLVVMTEDNNRRDSYTNRFNYKIKYPQHFWEDSYPATGEAFPFNF